MQAIADTLSEEIGFERHMSLGASEVYKTVSKDTDLGLEKTEARQRGRDPEDEVTLMEAAIERKERKVD